MISEIYIMDTSSLIQLKEYPTDIFPTLWDNIENMIVDGGLKSPKEVLKELEKKDDELKKWASSKKELFVELDSTQINLTKQILQVFPSFAKPNKFLADADPFIVSLALKFGDNPQETIFHEKRISIVITEEKLDGEKIKIPYVCNKYDIECINLFEFFRRKKWKF